MKDFDIFESYKSDTRYPLVAELKIIEEHHLFLPRQPQAGDLWWWGHNHLQQLLKGLSVRFYAR